MKKIIFLLFSFILTTFYYPAFAQKKATATNTTGYEIMLNIKGATDPVVYLAIHYKNQLYLKDSAKLIGNSRYLFKGSKPLDQGLYTLISHSRKPYWEVIIDKTQHFEAFLDTTMNPNNFSVVNNDEISQMLYFQKKAGKARAESDALVKRIKEIKDTPKKDSVEIYEEKLKEINSDMENFISSIIEAHPDYLFSKLQKAYKTVKIPDLPVKSDGTRDSAFQYIYYRDHYWDNFDLADSRMIYLPVTEQKYDEYIKKVLYYQETDTIIKYINKWLQKTEKDSLMYRYTLDRLGTEYQGNDIGYDAVFVNIVENNQLKGKTKWMDDDLIKKYKRRIDELKRTLIGTKAPEIIMPDINGNWISSHQQPYKYVILWFWDPTCQTCKKESAELKQVYDSLSKVGKRNFEVYAVVSDSDSVRWKKIAIERGYPWICVGGHTANVDWKEAYVVSSNPQMFILNEKREIIMNKRIEKDKIPLFLEQYERIEALKKKNNK